MGQVIDTVRHALPGVGSLRLDGVDETDAGTVVRVSLMEDPRCPVCDGSAVSYHSQYDRVLRDLPWQGQQVYLRLRMRRFRCLDLTCPRKVFAERTPAVPGPRARETSRLSGVIRKVGYAMGGLPGSRLLDAIGITVSDDTVLRRIKTQPRKAVAARVLGVDEWAWRKRLRYGTILVDLERSRVIDLLPVRTAESLASWLRTHPGAEVIARDRSTLFADGGCDGAPDAVHVIDRFHLVSNLTEAVERDVQRLQAQPSREAPATASGETAKIERVNWKEARRRRCRAARYQRYLAVVAAEREGLTQLAIAARVGLGADTVAGWLHAGAFPERQIRSDRVRLHHPVESGGFSDDDSLAPHAASSAVPPPPARARHVSAGRVAALLTQPPGKLTPPQETYLDSFLDRWPEGRSLRRLVLSFRAMLRWRRSSLTSVGS